MSINYEIKIFIDQIDNKDDVDKIKYSLFTIFNIIGLKINYTSKEESEIFVTNKEVLNNDKIIIQDFLNFNTNDIFKTYNMKNPISKTFCLLVGQNELHKDDFNVPIVSKYKNILYIKKAFIDEYSKILKKQIEIKYTNKIFKTNNLSNEFYLTHDIDMPVDELLNDIRLKLIKKAFYKREMKSFIKQIIGITFYNIRTLISMNPVDKHQNYRYSKWLKLMKHLKGKATFYIATTSAGDIHSSNKDVYYNYKNKHIVKMIKNILDDGHEVGLHGSIYSTKKKLLIEEINRFHRQFKFKPFSIRNHYWSFFDGIETIKNHQSKEFLYDSSIGLNDSFGFRRGTAFPFYPYDLISNKMLDIVEIPCTLMDGGIFYKQKNNDKAKIELHNYLSYLQTIDAPVVINWHIEQANFNRLNNAGKVLINYLYSIEDNMYEFKKMKDLALYWNIRKNDLKS